MNTSAHFYWASALAIVAMCAACATCQYADDVRDAAKYTACMRELKSAEHCGRP